MADNRMRFGLIGCGAMGKVICEAFDEGRINGRLTRLFDSRRDCADNLSELLDSKPMVSDSVDELIDSVDFVVEAASQQAVREYAVKVVSSGRNILVMSVGALMDEDLLADLLVESRISKGVIYIPSGAVAGVDGLLSASMASIKQTTLTTTKPPSGLGGVDYLVKKGLDVDSLSEATVVYEGDAKEAASLFPKNINVAAVLSLASGSPVTVKIIADPHAKKNTHEILAEGDFGRIETRIDNVPSPDNPKTSYLACLSAIATLRKLTQELRIGN